MKCCIVFLCLFLCLCIPVAAENTDVLIGEQLEAAGGDALFESLPEETRRFLRGIGIETIGDTADTAEPQQWLTAVLELLQESFSEPLRQCGMLLAVIVLCALVDSLRLLTNENGGTAVFQTVSVLAVAVSTLPSLSGMIQASAEALESLQVFMHSFVPVYGALLLTSGRGLSAAGYQGVVMLAAQVFSWGNTHLLLPLTTASFGLGLAGGLNRELRLEALAGRLNRFCVWALGLTASLFTGMLSIKNVVDAAADSMGKRVLRLSVANLIPVVGGALSETVNTVAGCLSVTRSVMGVFGLLATAALVLPGSLRLLGWSVLLGLLASVAEVFSLEAVATLMKAAGGTVKVLLALLSIQGLFMILTVTVVSATGGSV